MTAHRMVPVPLQIDEEERGPLWRCVGCGIVRKDPAARLTDCCQALSLLDEELA